LNNGFNTDKFKNLIEYKSGYTWSKDQELNSPENGSIRVLTVTNIQKELDLSSELYLKNVSGNDKQEKAVSKDWTIAVSSNGNRKRIGNAVFIDEDTEFLFASFLTGFKPKENSDILPEYFSYWMKSHPIQERITSISEGTTGLGNLDIRYLRNMDIEYPPLPEQRAIASVLSKVDDAIAAVNKTIAKAERLKKALMQNLLTGRLKPDGTQRSEDEFYTHEKFGKVPVEWEVKKLRNITSDIIMGQSPSSQSYNEENIGLPYVQGNTDMGDKYPNIRVFTSDPKKLSLKNDILISVRAPVGELYINNLEKIAIGRGFGALRFEDENLVSYFFQFFNYDKKQFIRLEQGTTFTEIGQREVRNLLLPVPPQLELKSICGKLNNIDESIEKKELKIQTLERLKKALMQNLLTGKKRLKADYIQGFADG